MAAVGCMDISGDKNNDPGGRGCGSDLLAMCKKNGLSHGFHFTEKNGARMSPNGVIFENFSKLNGSLKNSFTKPLIPSLRSRGERLSAGLGAPRRTRRLSKHDIGDVHAKFSRDEEYHSRQPDAPPPCTFTCADVFSSLKEGVSSPTDEKEICHITDVVCPSDSVTPDTSRSCTPLSISGTCVLSPISKDSRSADDACTTCKEAPAPPPACLWKDCTCGVLDGSIIDHIRACHVDPQHGRKFVCLWKGCKVYDKCSSSRSWLERHVLSHSGDKPFKCIVDGCSLRFTSQQALARHVNSHFALEAAVNAKQPKSREGTPTKLWKRKKIKKRKYTAVKATDFFDSGIMEGLHNDLYDLVRTTQLDLNRSSLSVTFRSSVIAKRTEKTGTRKVLLHWTPENVLADEWVPEEEARVSQSIPVHLLPQQTLASLHPSLYRQHRYRKHRRK